MRSTLLRIALVAIAFAAGPAAFAQFGFRPKVKIDNPRVGFRPAGGERAGGRRAAAVRVQIRHVGAGVVHPGDARRHRPRDAGGGVHQRRRRVPHRADGAGRPQAGHEGRRAAAGGRGEDRADRVRPIGVRPGERDGRVGEVANPLGRRRQRLSFRPDSGRIHPPPNHLRLCRPVARRVGTRFQFQAAGEPPGRRPLPEQRAGGAGEDRVGARDARPVVRVRRGGPGGDRHRAGRQAVRGRPVRRQHGDGEQEAVGAVRVGPPRRQPAAVRRREGGRGTGVEGVRRSPAGVGRPGHPCAGAEEQAVRHQPVRGTQPEVRGQEAGRAGRPVPGGRPHRPRRPSADHPAHR
jgi:hypothetical protein